MRLAIYARVSTREQTVDLQLETVRAYAKARSAEVVGEYLDQGVSGAKDRRPALDRVATPLRSGRSHDLTAGRYAASLGPTAMTSQRVALPLRSGRQP